VEEVQVIGSLNNTVLKLYRQRYAMDENYYRELDLASAVFVMAGTFSSILTYTSLDLGGLIQKVLDQTLIYLLRCQRESTLPSFCS
jgi:hypothetical protein